MHSLEDWLIRSYELGDLPKTIEREMVYRAPAWYTRMKASGKLKAEIERLTIEAWQLFYEAAKVSANSASEIAWRELEDDDSRLFWLSRSGTNAIDEVVNSIPEEPEPPDGEDGEEELAWMAPRTSRITVSDTEFMIEMTERYATLVADVLVLYGVRSSSQDEDLGDEYDESDVEAPPEPHPEAPANTYIIPRAITGDPSSYDLLMWAFNEVVEIIECLAEEIPGQAKGDLSHVIQVMESWPLEWTVAALPHLREGLQILHAEGCRQAAPSLAGARKCMWKELAGE